MMKKKSVKAAFYAGAVILACFYLLVLWWGKNPDVGLEYRMYYLTHELSDWPGYGKLSYEPGTTEYCTTLKDKDGNVIVKANHMITPKRAASDNFSCTVSERCSSSSLSERSDHVSRMR